jgi:hypothetical protein
MLVAMKLNRGNTPQHGTPPWQPRGVPRGQLCARILTLLRRAHQHRRKRSADKDWRTFTSSPLVGGLEAPVVAIARQQQFVAGSRVKRFRNPFLWPNAV